jgi:hypothetical protein
MPLPMTQTTTKVQGWKKPDFLTLEIQVSGLNGKKTIFRLKILVFIDIHLRDESIVHEIFTTPSIVFQIISDGTFQSFLFFILKPDSTRFYLLLVE